ncbi:hypothetical protein SAMN05216219_3222 [Mycetocola miduiensis]|uniref:Uncharacterized protein n=1 Tax=Mycetocola miduiensis TaxID=995034 RepID=A0A1I5BFP0_9MICO|nr:hypothetical protein SAMN05216219_1856 [Mycetocola miduiensis]SFN73558.1 hypothetical protein SAMN05216219_1861 [Mycetocola miduiensis]SFO05352.1 hypothetical protein SAMN05216219_3222 [Mycetocola miduiensis]
MVPSQFRSKCFLLALMGGTLTLMRIGSIRYEYAQALVWEGKHRPARFACCTLLGPEGPEHDHGSGCGLYLWTFSCSADTSVAGWGGYRPYFENYTVDASILDLNI